MPDSGDGRMVEVGFLLMEEGVRAQIDGLRWW